MVIKMMNISGWAAGRLAVNISFSEHNPAAVRNILMVLGRIIEQVLVF